jgi:hypothetical protein
MKTFGNVRERFRAHVWHGRGDAAGTFFDWPSVSNCTPHSRRVLRDLTTQFFKLGPQRFWNVTSRDPRQVIEGLAKPATE